MVQYHKQDIGIDISRQWTGPSLLRSVMLPFYNYTHTLPSPLPPPWYIHSLVLCHNLHHRNLDHLSLPEEGADSNAMGLLLLHYTLPLSHSCGLLGDSLQTVGWRKMTPAWFPGDSAHYVGSTWKQRAEALQPLSGTPLKHKEKGNPLTRQNYKQYVSSVLPRRKEV